MKRHRRDLEVMSDLNLTNMIDTAFVLLIVFILVAPAMKSGLDIDLPKVSGDPKVSDASKTLTISIKKGEPGFADQIIVEDRRLSVEELKATIASKQLVNKKLEIALESDRLAVYDTVAQVLSVLKELNIESIGLLTDPAEAKSGDKKPIRANR